MNAAFCADCGQPAANPHTTRDGSSVCDFCWDERTALVDPFHTRATEVSVLPQSEVDVPLGSLGSLGSPVDGAEVEWLLSEHAAGRIEPYAVNLTPLPEHATEPMRRVVAFYRLVRGLRLWAGDERDVPFARRWVAAKVGLPEATVRRALTQLQAADVLERVGELAGRDRPGTALWAPGLLPQAAVGVEGRGEVVRNTSEVERELADEPLMGDAQIGAGRRTRAATDHRALAMQGRALDHAPHDRVATGGGGER